MIETLEVTSPDEADMEAVAKSATEVLLHHYPDHIWLTGWAPGNNLVIKNLSISSQIGRVLHVPDVVSPTDFNKRLMRIGGEFLELAGMPRGRWNGEMADKLDGNPMGEYHESLRK